MLSFDFGAFWVLICGRDGLLPPIIGTVLYILLSGFIYWICAVYVLERVGQCRKFISQNDGFDEADKCLERAVWQVECILFDR